MNETLPLRNPVLQYPRPPYKRQTRGWPAGSGAAPMERLENFGGQTPIGRAGQPVELASIFVQLAAADASFATGQVYGAAGGGGQP